MAGRKAGDGAVYFIRHGETDWNRDGRFQGQRDIPLNETGRAQATANGESLARLIGDPAAYRFVASPLIRTRQTMELVRTALGLPAEGYETDARLKEVSYGDWEGHSYDELSVSRPDDVRERDADKWRYVPQGGESYSQLSRRFEPFLAEIEAPAVVVTHGGVIRCVRYFLEPVSPEEAVRDPIPQNRVYRSANGQAGWL